MSRDPSPDLETSIRGESARELADFASVWADLQLVEMSLHHRLRFTKPPDLFISRALWEQAVIAYGRCFDNAKRRGIPQELADRIAGDGQVVHREILRWRDKHVAHRIDDDKEATSVTLVYPAGADQAAGVRARVQITAGPDEERLTKALEELAKGLKDRLWREWFLPLESRIVNEAGSDPALRARAREFVNEGWARSFITINPSGS